MKATESKLGRPAEILLVEDNEGDVVLTQEGFEMSRLSVNLHHVSHGKECMQFLRKQGAYHDAPTPDLVLLDLNLPGMDGREVLRQISGDCELRTLPVVILTTSDADKDVRHMYDLRCSSYVVKPVDFPQFQRVIEQIGAYWFTVVALPPSRGDAGGGGRLRQRPAT